MDLFKIPTHCSEVCLNLKKSEDVTCGLIHCYPEENILFPLESDLPFEKIQRFISSLLKKFRIHFTPTERERESHDRSCAHSCSLHGIVLKDEGNCSLIKQSTALT